MIQEYCTKCKNCEFNKSGKELIEADDLILLDNGREINRFISISITTSNAISSFENNHSTFLRLLLDSKFRFAQSVFYILDIKFNVWRKSIIKLSKILRALFIRYTHSNKNCIQFKNIILNEVLYYFKKYYEDKVNVLYNFFKGNDINEKIIKLFMKSHDKLFEILKREVLKLNQPKENGQFDKYIAEYTYILNKCMELTVVEVSSINRLIVDKSAYVTSQVVNLILDENFNLIKYLSEDICNVDYKDVKLLFVEDFLRRYEFLFKV